MKKTCGILKASKMQTIYIHHNGKLSASVRKSEGRNEYGVDAGELFVPVLGTGGSFSCRRPD
jgi:RecA-family ATPase